MNMEINDVYEEFFRRVNGSPTFSKYCDEVFGIDLSQDGFADKSQLDFLIDAMGLNAEDICVDIGCGNGRISDYINRRTNASMIGLDYSPSAIEFARAMEESNPKLRFAIGDINDLRIPVSHFTAALLIDTVYFSEDYGKTLELLYGSLPPGGRIGICYSEFVFEKEKQIKKIEADETKIALIIRENGWESASTDLTDAHFELMKRKCRVSEKYKPDFEREGNGWLFDKVHRESTPQDFPKENFVKFTNRYFYLIRKAEPSTQGSLFSHPKL
jgi:ubiquinone/menaquinone biosynthesis C-methylase UbiE